MWRPVPLPAERSLLVRARRFPRRINPNNFIESFVLKFSPAILASNPAPLSRLQRDAQVGAIASRAVSCLVGHFARSAGVTAVVRSAASMPALRRSREAVRRRVLRARGWGMRPPYAVLDVWQGGMWGLASGVVPEVGTTRAALHVGTLESAQCGHHRTLVLA